jgi:hypothetical protein
MMCQVGKIAKGPVYWIPVLPSGILLVQTSSLEELEINSGQAIARKGHLSDGRIVPVQI